MIGDTLGIQQTPPASPIPPGRDTAGRFMAGNQVAVVHGLRGSQLPAALAHLHDEVAAFEADCLADEGDVADIPARRRALLHDRARIERRIRQIDDTLELRGLIDRRGRLRTAWLQRLEGLVATAIRLDTLLGLQRGQRRVLTLNERMAEAAAEIELERRQARAPRPSADGDDLPSGGRSRAPASDGDDEPDDQHGEEN